jgi:flagellum-specific peptidoglycan hydrolase FlgJ
MKKSILLLIILISFMSHTRPNNERDLLTKENLWLTIKAMDIKYPEIAFAQAILETGHFKSQNCKTSNNLFGMMMPNVRETVAVAKNERGFAVYETWIHSVQDYALYQDYMMKRRNMTRSQYLSFINKKYSESRGYANKLNKIIKQHKDILSI